MSQPTIKSAGSAYPQFKVNQTPVYANQRRKRKGRRKPTKRKYLLEPNWI